MMRETGFAPPKRLYSEWAERDLVRQISKSNAVFDPFRI